MPDGRFGASDSSGVIVVCRCCQLTESLEVATELWAALYLGGHLVNWICGECWHADVEQEFERA